MHADPDPDFRLGPVTAPDLGSPTTLLLIRHGHTDQTGQVLAGGDDVGPGLDSAGRQAVSRLASVLADLPAEPGSGHSGRPCAVISSSALRARQTAGLIGGVTGLEPQIDDDWQEVRAGYWHGLPVTQIVERWPELYRAWCTSSSVAPPNGESSDQLVARVALAADRLVTAHRGQVVAVVCHAGPIQALLCAALGADPVAARRLRIDPASVSVLRRWCDGGCEVSMVNSALGNLSGYRGAHHEQ